MQLLQTYRAKFSVITLSFLYVGLIFCNFLSPYSPHRSFEGFLYHPPNITLYSQELGFGLQVQRYIVVDTLSQKRLPLKGEYEKIHFFRSGHQYKLLGIFPSNIHLFQGQQYPVFIMGSDALGRDIFSRILYGSRVSLTIGILALLISIPWGCLLGGIAGYYGGIWDWIIMRFAELIMLIPSLYLLLFLRSIFLPNTTPAQAYIIITIIFSFFSFPSLARMIRGMVYSLRQEDFIKSAQLDAVPDIVIIVRHILPYVSSIVLISASFSIPATILSEVVLGYLGLGITEPSVSWGALLNRDVLRISTIQKYPWLLYPGLFLTLASISFNFLGERLRDMLDPYHSGVRSDS